MIIISQIINNELLLIFVPMSRITCLVRLSVTLFARPFGILTQKVRTQKTKLVRTFRRAR